LLYDIGMNGLRASSTLGIELPPELARRVRRIAADLGLAPAEILRAAIIGGLARFDKNEKDPAAAPAGKNPPPFLYTKR